MRQLQRLLALNERCNEGDDPVVIIVDGDDCDTDVGDIDDGLDKQVAGYDGSDDPGD